MDSCREVSSAILWHISQLEIVESCAHVTFPYPRPCKQALPCVNATLVAMLEFLLLVRK
jgi:hypothetical protein